ncbi:MAG: amino acid permease [Paludibacter sp.]|jgi:amino acid transporter|nr:amino acid permease [Paludibacter sp.]
MPSSKNNATSSVGLGTLPVFLTAICTILGAIMFLRFGWAVGTIGFWGVIVIILLGHLVTVPTALAISELATNKRVEGGGEYFIISRSFGLNIGSTIGISLFLSQAISVAFYIIAFTEAFQFFFDYLKTAFEINLPRQAISVPALLILISLILTKGSKVGLKTMYFVMAIMGLSIIAFFVGKTGYHAEASTFIPAIHNPDKFFVVFAVVFPAFTGITAGVGLSGDLKNPAKSIPLGTIAGTCVGLIVYVLIAWKLSVSVSVNDMLADQLIMTKIAIGGAILIPLGLAAATFSSALSCILVAPRTLQALARDEAFPSKRLNTWLSHGRAKDGEPQNAAIITSLIAIVFVVLGGVNAVAEIISIFFLVTYGSLSLISFLHHFGSSPSYRPTFKSRWFISLIGFVFSVWVMFQINSLYAIFSFGLMILIYLYISNYHKSRTGLESIFTNSIFQLNRNLQVTLQKSSKKIAESKNEWRPSAICFSKDSLERLTAFNVLNWISYKYGFGTYIHLVEGYYGKETIQKSKEIEEKLISYSERLNGQVYIDTIISPSYTSAVSQAVQTKGIAGMENNMVIFEFEKENPVNLPEIIDNFAMVRAGNFDVLIVGSSHKQKMPGDNIHIWISGNDTENANLMIMLGFIILGHPEWKHSNIRIFEITVENKYAETQARMDELLRTGRLPISAKNVEIILQNEKQTIKDLINQRSSGAGLTIIGYRSEKLKDTGTERFQGYEQLKTVIFVNSGTQRELE